MKSQLHLLRRATSVVFVATCSLFAFAVFAPAAFAINVLHDPGTPDVASPQTAPLPQTARIVLHNGATAPMCGSCTGTPRRGTACTRWTTHEGARPLPVVRAVPDRPARHHHAR